MSDDCNDQSPPATAWIMPAEFLARAAVVDVWPRAGGWCSHDPRAIDDRTSGNAHHAARSRPDEAAGLVPVTVQLSAK